MNLAASCAALQYNAVSLDEGGWVYSIHFLRHVEDVQVLEVEVGQ